jgi:hypothetical protein
VRRSLAAAAPLLAVPAALAEAAGARHLPHLAAAVAAGVVAVALAVFDFEGPAVMALALGPLALSATRPPGELLLAGGLLATGVPARPMLLAALPGAVGVTTALTPRPLGHTELALAVGLAAAAAALVWHPARRPKPKVALVHLPLAVIAGALLLIPDTTRSGAAHLADYQRGAALAAAAAVLAVSARLTWNLRRG